MIPDVPHPIPSYTLCPCLPTLFLCFPSLPLPASFTPSHMGPPFVPSRHLFGTRRPPIPTFQLYLTNFPPSSTPFSLLHPYVYLRTLAPCILRSILSRWPYTPVLGHGGVGCATGQLWRSVSTAHAIVSHEVLPRDLP
jgi:hypothetical protein